MIFISLLIITILVSFLLYVYAKDEVEVATNVTDETKDF
jgi:hypothetical protein